MDAIIERLRESEAELVGVVSGLTDAQWRGGGGEGRWSGQEIVEHLILVERGVVTLVRRAMGQPAGERGVVLGDDEVWARLTAVGRPVAAPERVRPTGQWVDREEALAEFSRRRAETVAFGLGTEEGGLRGRWIQLPVGELDGAQALLMLAAHALRHVAQIRELA
jgi:hypothetical protein